MSVSGRNGSFDIDNAYTVRATRLSGVCSGVSPIPGSITNSHSIAGGNYATVIAMDRSRIAGTPAELTAMDNALTLLIGRPDVNGVLIDFSSGGFERIDAARTQAQNNPECPFAQNVLASEMKNVTDAYIGASTAQNGAEYVVLLGNDGAIPFFRYPDPAPIGKESEYDIPILDPSTSIAALKLDYILSQDAYGSNKSVTLQESTLPIPKLPVGRLVETASEIENVINAYLSDGDGIYQPSTAFLSSYGFLYDGSTAVEQELVDGMGGSATVSTLFNDATVDPSDPAAWTANQVENGWLSTRQDIAYLAGHFTHFSLEAADYQTRLTVDEFLSSTAASGIDMNNTLIFSSGCHSGYNLVDPHGNLIPDFEVDWPQAFAQRGAYFIGGTGYQYGDSDLTEYAERLYLTFSQELRSPGPVAIGDALVAAKQEYLSDTTVEIDGVYEKTILVSTLFGLPMFKLDLAGAPGTSVTLPPIGSNNPTPVLAGPGAATGLESSDVTLAPSTTLQTTVFTSTVDNSQINVTYYEGDSGFTTRSGFPILPVSKFDANHPNGLDEGVLQGVGLRGGTYVRETNVVPLTSGAVTELAGPHEMFRSDFFYPPKPWTVNYYDVLIDPDNGITRLNIAPLQYRSTNSSSFSGTYLRYTDLDFRLYYLDFDPSLADVALAGSPAIAKGRATTVSPTQIDFEIIATEPISGVQEVWVTWTDSDVASGGTGTWQSIDLSQTDPDDDTLWTGTLTLTSGEDPQDIRYLVQATNAAGLVTFQNNDGQYYVPDVDPGALTGGEENEPSLNPTTLTFVSAPSSGLFATDVTLTANLSSSGSPLVGETINFSLGDLSASAVTDSGGNAVVDLNLITTPDDYQLQASFGGTLTHEEALVQSPYTLNKQPTSLAPSFATSTISQGSDLNLIVTLTDSLSRPISERFIFFSVVGESFQTAIDTNVNGVVELDQFNAPPGTYTLNIGFAEDEDYGQSTTSVVITVEAGNMPPVANDSSVSVSEDVTTTIDITPSISDIDGNLDLGSITITTGSTAGATLLNNADGTFEYTSALNYNGPDSFTFEVCDTEPLCDTATVSITVDPINDDPVITNPGATPIQEGSDLTILLDPIVEDVESADADISWTAASSDNGVATAALDTNGDLLISAIASGVADITLTATDPDSGTDQVTFTVTVTALPAPIVCQSILYPLYIYPTIGTVYSDVAASASSDLPITVIINPNNGPVATGTPQFTDYSTGMATLDAGSVKMIGYVRTDYTNQDINTVKAEIDQYELDYAPYITGIFLDEASNNPADIAYYNDLYAYIQGKAAFDQVVINPGTTTDQSYFSTATDIGVVFENDFAAWQAHIPAVFESGLDPAELSVMVHNVANTSEMNTAITLANSRNIGNIFLTDDQFSPNPWDNFPTFWSAMVNRIEQNNQALNCDFTPPPSNVAPTVNAGADITITLPATATLNATFNDDGLPVPPAETTVEWEVVSGPGTVTISDPFDPNPNVEFDTAGVYTLSVTADDGELQAVDTVTITVLEAACTNHLAPVAPPNGTIYAADTFDDAVDPGWGNADIGGAYTYFWAANTIDKFSVFCDSGFISFDNSGQAAESVLTGVNVNDSLSSLSFSVAELPTNRAYLRIHSRRQSFGATYRSIIQIEPDGTVFLFVDKIAGGWKRVSSNENSGVQILPDTQYEIKTETSGSNPTTIKIKIWESGQAEPAGWQHVVTDAETILQSSGSVGLRANILPGESNLPFVFAIDNYYVSDPSAQAPATVIVTDSFDRSTSNGWGQADQGGSYTHLWGSTAAAAFTTNGSRGLIEYTTGGAGREAILNTPLVMDSISEITFSVDKLPSADGFIRLHSRHVNDYTTYRGAVQIKPNGDLRLFVDRQNGGNWGQVSLSQLAGLTIAPNVDYRIKMETFGSFPTTIRLKVWEVGTPEPVTWQHTASDSTISLQAAGGFGLRVNALSTLANAPIIFSFEDYNVMSLGPINPPPSLVLAEDTFSRTESVGWATAETGGAYTHRWSSAAVNDFSVSNGEGIFTMNPSGVAREAHLDDVSALDTRSEIVLTLSDLPSTRNYVRLFSRRVNGTSGYRGVVQIDPSGAVSLWVDRLDSGSWARVSTTQPLGFQIAPETAYNIKMETTGTFPTSIRMKLWAVGDTEPSSWQHIASDSTNALQNPGAVGLRINATGPIINTQVDYRFDNLLITDLGSQLLALD